MIHSSPSATPMCLDSVGLEETTQPTSACSFCYSSPGLCDSQFCVLVYHRINEDIPTSHWRSFLKSELLAIIRSIVAESIHDKLLVLDFFVRALPLVGDLEVLLQWFNFYNKCLYNYMLISFFLLRFGSSILKSYLKLRYEASVLREVRTQFRAQRFSLHCSKGNELCVYHVCDNVQFKI